ncbi:MAG TPA: hypothetical protein VGO11_02010 [Chthoniobacteraceae bacterium]|jgi:hypothetical protein|nr:hypothetical protein [Chthoniobacteraceae bacterium]
MAKRLAITVLVGGAVRDAIDAALIKPQIDKLLKLRATASAHPPWRLR